MDYPIDIVAILEYADTYSERVCDLFFAEKEYIEGSDLRAITPVTQVNAFLVRSIFEAWRSEAQQMQSPFFNFDAPEVKKHFNALMKALSSHVQVRREDFQPILEEAVINTLRLAFRPTETLHTYLGELDQRIPIERHLKPQLKYLRLHPSFLRALHATLEADEVIEREDLFHSVEQLAQSGHLFELPYGVMQQLNQTLPAKISEFVPDWSMEEEDETEDFLEYAAPMEVQSENKEVDTVALAESFAEKSEHFDQEEFAPETEEEAIILEEDGLSEEEWIGNEERPLTEADLKGYQPEEVLQETVEASESLPYTPPQTSNPTEYEDTAHFVPKEERVEEKTEIREEQAPQERKGWYAEEDDEVIDNLFENEPSLEDIDPEAKEEPRVERASSQKAAEKEKETPSYSRPAEDAPAAKQEEEKQKGREEEPEEDGPIGNALHERLKGNKERKEEDSLHGSLSDKKQSKRAKIKGTIPLNLKFRFLNELFGGDNSAFEQAIDTIDSIDDYHAAIAVIKEKYMRQFDWDLGEDTTREFLSMVSRRYE